MKLMKTKLGLSALALACVGAGVMGLQSSHTVKADVDTSGFTMENGAAVCLETDFSGIRWTTTVTKAFHEANGEGNAYGVIVAPTNAFTGELTHTTALTSGNVVDLPAGILTFGDSDSTVSYYSVIDYNDILNEYEGTLSDDEVLEKAYAMELTARAYVQDAEGNYIYANMDGVSTSRSARQVAIAAELAGELDEKYRDNGKDAQAAKGVEYYGADEAYTPNTLSTGAVGTPVVDLTNVEADVAVENFSVSGTIQEVLIGAESVEYTQSGTTLTINEAAYTTAGEQYVTVFNTDGNIYTKPVIVATKVLKQASDLAMFNAKGDNGVYSTKVKTDGWLENYWNSEQEQSGYYVLGQNIEAEGYVHGSKYAVDAVDVVAGTVAAGDFNNATWNAATAYKDQPIGLTGTFNGMGFAINNLEIGSQREGLFGIVNGGTVKNAAFVDVKAEGEYKFVLAQYLYKATVENVYIKTDAYETDSEGNVTSMGFPLLNCAGLADYAAGNTQISSCLIHYSETADTSFSTGSSTGMMFLNYNVNFECSDVYCVSDFTLGSGYTHALMYRNIKTFDDDENYTETKRVWLAENEVSLTCTDDTVLTFAPDLSTTNADGTPTVVPADNTSKKTLVYTELDLKFHSDANRPRVVMSGAFRYNSFEALYKHNTTYKNLANTGCWYLDGNNALVWAK